MRWWGMMIQFEARWAEMEPSKGYQRVDENHPLDFYFALEVSGERVLLLVTDWCVDVPSQSHAIQILCRQRNDNRWALMFRLIKPELGWIFSHLCEDIVEYGRKCSTKSDPAGAVIRRFIHWQRLLERSQNGLLDLASQKGLIGELLFLRDFALPAYPSVQAAEGWEGPLDAEQDFRYADRIFEIKTMNSGASKVRISSAEQLDVSGGKLQLVAVVMSVADNNDDNSFSLTDVVATLRKEFENDFGALQLFEERLLSAGYIDCDEYSRHKYCLERFRFFSVVDGFPKIVRCCLPAGIGKATYEVDLSQCQPYEINQRG